jgi:hypothetical protein
MASPRESGRADAGGLEEEAPYALITTLDVAEGRSIINGGGLELDVRCLPGRVPADQAARRRHLMAPGRGATSDQEPMAQ